MLKMQAVAARNFADTARRCMQEYADIASGFGRRIVESPAGSGKARRAVTATTGHAHEAIESAGDTSDPVTRTVDAAAKMPSQAAHDVSRSNEAASCPSKAAASKKKVVSSAKKTASRTSEAASTTTRFSKKKAASRKTAGKKRAS